MYIHYWYEILIGWLVVFGPPLWKIWVNWDDNRNPIFSWENAKLMATSHHQPVKYWSPHRPHGAVKLDLSMERTENPNPIVLIKHHRCMFPMMRKVPIAAMEFVCQHRNLNYLWNVETLFLATDTRHVNLSSTMQRSRVCVKHWHCSSQIGRTFESPAAHFLKVAATVRWHDNMRATTTDVSKSSGAV